MPESWRLIGFEERLDEWAELEGSADWLLMLVLNWLLSRIDDPYDGLRRQPDFDNLWFGVVPGSFNDDMVVVCSLWVFEGTHTLRCDRIATLSWPVE